MVESSIWLFAAFVIFLSEKCSPPLLVRFLLDVLLQFILAIKLVGLRWSVIKKSNLALPVGIQMIVNHIGAHIFMKSIL